MNKYIITGLAILLIPTFALAITVFNSSQTGSYPSNGYVLQTDGTNSTWVATSSLGISGSSSFGYPFPGNATTTNLDFVGGLNIGNTGSGANITQYTTSTGNNGLSMYSGGGILVNSITRDDGTGTGWLSLTSLGGIGFEPNTSTINHTYPVKIDTSGNLTVNGSTTVVTISNESMSLTNAMSYSVSTMAITVTQTALTGDILDIIVTGTQ